MTFFQPNSSPSRHHPADDLFLPNPPSSCSTSASSISSSHPSADVTDFSDPADWDLASIESSLSPGDPSLDELLLSDADPSIGVQELELDPLLFMASVGGGEYIHYQFDNIVEQPNANYRDFSTPSATSSSSSSPTLTLPNEFFHRHQMEAQARRNAQIAMAMSPFRKVQERLQAAQRRIGHQKAKRKFSLKNGPNGAEGKSRPRSIVNSSVRRWKTEIEALIVAEKNTATAEF